MNLKIGPVDINKISLNILKQKKYNKNINKVEKASVVAMLPFVALPLLAYNESPTSRHNLAKNLAKDAANKMYNNSSNTPITDRTQKNLEALKKAGVPERERLKYITSNGYMDKDGKEICKNKNVTSFTGAPEEATSYHNEMPAYDNIHSDVHTSSGDFATIEPEHQDVGFGQINAGLSDLQLPEGAEITEQLEQIAGMLDNPILEGVAAELLPGTKFLKPGKDLIDGDYEKAA